MNSIIERRGVRQFVKFGLVGVVSTAFDWGIYLTLTRFFAVHYLVAKIISASVAIIVSYFLNRRWTFGSSGPAKIHEFSKFATIALIGLGMNALIFFVAVGQLKIRDIYGLFIATLIVMFWNFFANKSWTFRQNR